MKIKILCIHFEFSFSHYVVIFFMYLLHIEWEGKFLYSFLVPEIEFQSKFKLEIFLLTEEILFSKQSVFQRTLNHET